MPSCCAATNACTLYAAARVVELTPEARRRIFNLIALFILMDDTDELILKELSENARVPFLEIAKKIGVSEGTIRNRVKKMLDDGIIRSFTVAAGTNKKVKAFVFIKTKRVVASAAEKISSIPSVSRVYEVSGDYDIIAYLEAESLGAINRDIDLIRKTYGIVSTNTSMVLK